MAGLLISPSGGASEFLIVNDTKAANTDAGASVAAGFQTRVLNTTQVNTIAGASLGSNQITLPAGNYDVFALAPGFSVEQHKAYLYNVTDAANSLIGSSEYANVTTGAQSSSVVMGRITIAAQKVFELRHYTTNLKATNGLGAKTNAAVSEIYSIVKIVKV